MNELKETHVIMLQAQGEKGRTITLRELAALLGKFPVDNYVSAVRDKVLELRDMGAVKEHRGIRDRKYEAVPYQFD